MALGKYKDIMAKNGQINAKILGVLPMPQNQNIIFEPRGKYPDIMLLLSKIFAHCNRKGIIAQKNSSNASIYISNNYSVKNSSKS